MQALVSLATLLLRCVLAFFRGRGEQAIIELALRQQLAAYAQARPRPRLTSLDRAFWVALHQLWPRWKEVLVIVKPETVVRWHRKGFRFYWRALSRRAPGRPRIPQEVRELICRLAFENGWRARKIQGELSKLGFTISLATVSRYLPKGSPDPGRRQRWMTFLRNHQDAISAMDFCIVPSVSFQLLYVWFVIDHSRRRLIHFNVTTNPIARWVIKQLREAFPSDRIPRYLLFDRDSIFSAEVVGAIRSFEIDPVRTAYRTPGRTRSPSGGWEPAEESCSMTLSSSANVISGACSLTTWLLQRRAGPHPPRGLTRWSSDEAPALLHRQGRRLAPCRGSSPSVRLGEGGVRRPRVHSMA